MLTVWKYRIPKSPEHAIGMPQGAKILRVAEQDWEVTLWALVDTEKPIEYRSFAVLATGEALDPTWAPWARHVGTYISGAYVWHVFEITT